MNRKPAKRSSLFLLELIIVILFFSLASAVCVRFFVKSHTISQDTTTLNMAVNQVSAYAELFLSDSDFAEELVNDAHSTVYYDGDWQTCSEDDAVFSLQITIAEDENFQNGTFSMNQMDSENQIYSVSVKKYVDGEVRHE